MAHTLLAVSLSLLAFTASGLMGPLCVASAAAPAQTMRLHVTGPDLVFEVPYQSPTSPASSVLEASTSFLNLDLYLLLDRTGSMVVELDEMRNQFSSIIGALSCSPAGLCVNDEECPPGSGCFEGSCFTLPASPSCVPDIWSGVGCFDECNTYLNLVSVQPDPSVTAAAIPGVGPGSAEAPIQAAGQVANAALGTNSPGCSPSGIACPGFRSDALRVLVQITDADNQASGSCSGITAPVAGDALSASGILYGAVVGNDDDSGAPGTPLEMAQQIGLASGSVDSGGQPFVVFAEDASVVTATTDLVRSMLDDLVGDATLEVVDDEGDAVDARLFVDHVEVDVSGTGACTAGLPTEDTNGDGLGDAFPLVTAGTPLCWTIVPVAQNTIVPATASAQSFAVFLVVRLHGCIVHTARAVFEIPAVATAVDPSTPAALARLEPPHPSPATGSIVLDYRVPAEGPISIRVFDNQGRVVRTLVEGSVRAGAATVTWDARDEAGVRVRPGLYHVRMRVGAATLTRKVTLLD